MAGPQAQTFTNVTPIQSAPQTFTNVTPIGQSQPSVWDVLTQPTEKTDAEYGTYRGAAGVAGATVKGLDDVARGTQGALEGLYNTVRHPIDTAKSIASLPSQAAQVPAAVKDINASPDPLGHYANAAQDTASQGAGQALTALAGAGVSEAVPYIGPVGKAVVKGYAKKLVPGEIGEAIKAVNEARKPNPALTQSKPLASAPSPAAAPAAQTGEALGQIPARGSIAQSFGQSRSIPGQNAPEIIQPPARTPVAPLPPRSGLMLPEQTPSTIDQAVSSPARTLFGENPPDVFQRPQPAAPIPPRSGLALPAAPRGAELSDLSSTGARPASQTGEALQPIKRGSIAGAMAKSVEQSPPPFQRGNLQELLNKSVGAGPPPNPKAPIYQRGQISQQMKAAPSEDLTPVLKESVDKATAVPEGHISVESSALKSYKYDPAAQEFHAQYNSNPGKIHIFGDVSPEAAQAFEQADSKGTAMQAIRRNPEVARIINGKRVSVKPGR